MPSGRNWCSKAGSFVNAALTELCLRAHAWLQAADPRHRATIANLRQLQQRCDADLYEIVHTGEFWQYTGHGAWNSISIRQAGNESLRIDAFWMRIGRVPVQDYGPAAMRRTLERHSARGRRYRVRALRGTRARS